MNCAVLQPTLHRALPYVCRYRKPGGALVIPASVCAPVRTFSILQVKPFPFLVVLFLLAMLPLFFLRPEGWVAAVPTELHALAHVAIFGLLAALLMRLPVLRRGSFASRAVLVLLLVLFVSIGIELLQPAFDRSADLQDIRRNLVGALVAVSFYAPPGARRRIAMGTTFLLLAAELTRPAVSMWDRQVAENQFPVLGEFETRFEHRRWTTGVPDSEVARAGSRSLRVTLRPGPYPGTALVRSLGDWSHYDRLSLSLYNPRAKPLVITISVRDQVHFQRSGAYEDRYNERFRIDSGWNDLNIPMASILSAPETRTLDLSDLSELAIFVEDLREPVVFFVDRVQLSND